MGFPGVKLSGHNYHIPPFVRLFYHQVAVLPEPSNGCPIGLTQIVRGSFITESLHLSCDLVKKLINRRTGGNGQTTSLTSTTWVKPRLLLLASPLTQWRVHTAGNKSIPKVRCPPNQFLFDRHQSGSAILGAVGNSQIYAEVQDLMQVMFIYSERWHIWIFASQKTLQVYRTTNYLFVFLYICAQHFIGSVEGAWWYADVDELEGKAGASGWRCTGRVLESLHWIHMLQAQQLQLRLQQYCQSEVCLQHLRLFI
ncbi:uncharacterized protein [Hyperolius riggenbachi]|uniref:uncharacterized protein n=1 Tax=Hyperolius riggenbachi TaxID=752182 RepID=UPI0035A37D85